MPRYDVFISYRREGGEHLAGRIRDSLKERGYNVFFDVESLRNGDFNYKLLDTIEQTPNFVLVCTKGALNRCIDEGDWVRRELAHALASGVNVVPVLTRDFEFPEMLPDDIAAIRNQHGPKSYEDYYEAFVDRLCEFFVGIKLRRRKGIVSVAIGLCALSLAVILAFIYLPNKDGGLDAEVEKTQQPEPASDLDAEAGDEQALPDVPIEEDDEEDVDVPSVAGIAYVSGAGGPINLRALPQHDSDLVLQVEENATLTFYGQTGVGLGSDGEQHTWFYVMTDDGIGGWVRGDLLALASMAESDSESLSLTPATFPRKWYGMYSGHTTNTGSGNEIVARTIDMTFDRVDEDGTVHGSCDISSTDRVDGYMHGSYTLVGTIDFSTRELSVEGDEWIEQGFSYMRRFRGTIDTSLRTIVGISDDFDGSFASAWTMDVVDE